MANFEFRLMDAEGKVSATKYHDCASDAEAVELSFKMMSGYRWIEIWVGSKAVARFVCH